MFRKKLKPFLWGLGFFCFLLLLIMGCLFIPWLRQHSFLLFIVFLIAFVFLKPFLENISDELHNFRYGKEGEKKVLEMLCKSLDDNYVYIPNYTIPNTRIGDIDGLLIGPKGIIIIEIKNWEGVFKISGPDVYRKLRGTTFQFYKKNPFTQTARQQRYLTKFLKEKGIDVRITPVIVLVCGKISSRSGKREIFIMEDYKLINHIFKLTQIPKYSSETREKILEALKLLQI